MADVTDIERLNYYDGEFLGAVDFAAEQEYHRDMRRRHNLGQHTWGIITGVDIAQFLNGGANNEVDVYIQPGVVVDGFGREIVVFTPFQLTTDLFADFPAKQTLGVWIGYSQQMVQPASDACTAANQANAFSRVQEGFQIVIAPLQKTDPILVGGNQVAPPSASTWTQPTTQPTLPTNVGDVLLAFDDSVPFQELPDNNTTATWLVQLGNVLWDSPNQRFLQTSPTIVNAGRQHAGAVAATIYAPAGALVIQDRSTPSPLPTGATGTAVEVQGTLTIDRLLTAEADLYIEGELYFKDPGGSDGDTVIGIQRIDNPTGGADLHIHLGDAPDPVNKPRNLTVGHGPAGSSGDAIVISVGSDGNVNMPVGALSFGTQQQVLNLSGTGFGIGVQPSTLYLRSKSDFAFYVGGKYSATQDDPGGGGSLSMLLNSSGGLTLNGALVVDHANLNNGAINPGLTFGSTSGEGICSRRTTGANQYGLDFYTNFTPRMSITNAGKVGIGTSAPSLALDVNGGISAGSLRVGTIEALGEVEIAGATLVANDFIVNGGNVTMDQDLQLGGVIKPNTGTIVTVAADLRVTGNLSKAGGGFRIDHPLDPAGKYMNHSFVESPERRNVYEGIAILDDNGGAIVRLPEWFHDVNDDFRYQLTSLGRPSPDLHVAKKAAKCEFKIAGGIAGAEVSWQITGKRIDAWAKAHPLLVEEEKKSSAPETPKEVHA